MAETAELEDSMHRMIQQLPPLKVGQCRDCRQFRFWIWWSDSTGYCAWCTKLNAERDEKERKREHDLEKARILNQTERERIKRKHELEEADRRRKHESIEADKKRQHDKDEAERRRKHEAHEADKKRRHDIEEAERRRKHESSENDKQRQHELNMERVKDARTKDYRALIDQLKNWDTDRLPYAIQLLNSLGAFPKGERTGIQEVGSFDDDEESHHVREYYY